MLFLTVYDTDFSHALQAECSHQLISGEAARVILYGKLESTSEARYSIDNKENLRNTRLPCGAAFFGVDCPVLEFLGPVKSIFIMET